MPLTNDYSPNAYSGRGREARGLPLNPAQYPDTRLMYHPRRWSFFTGGGASEWLPNLAELHLVPGINCIHSDGDPSLAYAERMKAGWLILDSVNDVSTYLVEYDGQPLKSGRVPKIYLLKWMIPRMVAGTCQVKYDAEIHVEWLRELVASGRVQADPEQIQILRGRIQDAHDRDDGDSSGDGKAARRAKAAAALLAQIDASPLPEPPKPARRRSQASA